MSGLGYDPVEARARRAPAGDAGTLAGCLVLVAALAPEQPRSDPTEHNKLQARLPCSKLRTARRSPVGARLVCLGGKAATADLVYAWEAGPVMPGRRHEGRQARALDPTPRREEL